MLTYARRPKQKQQANAAPSSMYGHSGPRQSNEIRSILDTYGTNDNLGIQRKLAEHERIRPPTSSNLNGIIQRRIRQYDDPIHGPLLDRYSEETGLPRETVTQHDPGYEAWLLRSSRSQGRRSQPPINITLDMNVPTIPGPDYSRTEDQLGAWEKVRFQSIPQISYTCGHVMTGGVESSYVTDIGLQLTRPRFEYFIARHIYQRSRGHGLDRGARGTWITIHSRVRRHAREHFTRFRQVIRSMRQSISQSFAALPTRDNPVQIPQAELEAYIDSLLRYYVARIAYELWETTCEWERTDYPRLLRGIPSVSGSIRPACDPEPSVPPQPIMPVVVRP